MKFLALALICLVAVNARSYTSSDERFFKDWASRYNRNYENIEEYMKRFRNWLTAYDYVLEVNSKQSDFKLALNQFADMDNEEFKHYYTGLNFKQRPVGGEVYLPTEGIPSEVDWVSKGAVTYVKNQGQCGSCWSFSTTGALEGLNFIKNGVLTPLSEQQLVDCSGSYGNMGCNGGLMDDAFEYTAAKGEETETDYPYTAANGDCQYDESKVVFKNTGHTDVPSDSVEQLEAAIAMGPVSVALDGGSYAFQLYSGGILSSDCGTSLDHGVLAVGYQTGSYFKIKNSWGASWGESGYIRLTTKADNSEGECGLLAQPSYPTLN